MQRAAILEDSQSPGRGLLGHTVVEDDHAVRDVLFDAMAGESPIAALAGDHGGDPPILEPAEQPPELGAQDRRVRERSEQGLDGVDDDALGADGVDGGAKAEKESFQVPVSCVFYLARNHVEVVDHELAVGFELGEVESQGGHVGDEVPGELLERHEHSWLAELGDPADEEFHREERLATTGGTANEGRATAGQAAAGHFVEPADARQSLRKFGKSGGRVTRRVQLTGSGALWGCHVSVLS